MREVLGDAVPDDILIEAVLKNKFDVQKALSVVLEKDKIQNLKVKHEAAIPTGKIAKGMLLLVLFQLFYSYGFFFFFPSLQGCT